ncbi:P-loop NTPase family protein [Helcococcus sueciensis]|uniref:hypothetical protein n=1 Tax=Helcococcus sueciensis TaxID=241555 RepID=UPI000418B225|nr:hypothetical protein [Helcococcus sueciensis]
MVTLILGKSGSGKTRLLIEDANKEKARGNGNIVFIDTDDKHIFTLDYTVRLINAKNFAIDSIESLYGFVAGIVSRDYDIEKVYLDGLYHLVEFDNEGIQKLVSRFNELSKNSNVEILLGLDQEESDLPEGIEAEIKVL